MTELTRYRAGNHRGAVEALRKSREHHGDEPSNSFFLAMAEWQLGNPDSALDWYAKAIEWMEQHPQIVGGEFHRYRAEAGMLRGVPEPASPEAESASEKHPNDKSLTTAQQKAGA